MSQWESLIAQALRQRAPLLQESIDCWRLFHGFSEGYPGVVIEVFNSLVVIDYKVDIRSELDELAAVLDRHLQPLAILSKGHQRLGGRLSQRMVWHKGPLEKVNHFCREGEVSYHIDAGAAHNVGLYLDAREVRKWLKASCQDKKILNLFAFTGSLGLNAALGGARQVVHVDRSRDLVGRIAASYRLNGLEFDERDFVRGDIYKHLPRAIQSGKTFDGIILDPPPKVYPSSYAKSRPLGQDFQQLVELSSQLLNPGGFLLCMFHRFDGSLQWMEQEILTASRCPLRVRERLTSGIDFPEAESERKLRVTIFSRPESPRSAQPAESLSNASPSPA